MPAQATVDRDPASVGPVRGDTPQAVGLQSVGDEDDAVAVGVPGHSGQVEVVLVFNRGQTTDPQLTAAAQASPTEAPS